MNFPFPDSPDTAVFTCRHILDEGKPILYASHYTDDGMWQFLCGETHIMDEARIVSLMYIYQRDPSVGELGDMPPGCFAERHAIGDPWVIQKKI